MSFVNKDKVSPAGFAALASTDLLNIYEVAAVLKKTTNDVEQRVTVGTLSAPLYGARGDKVWTKAMLTASGITDVSP